MRLAELTRQPKGSRTQRLPMDAPKCGLQMEAEVGIEPTHKAFAEPCLTTWLPRHCPNGA